MKNKILIKTLTAALITCIIIMSSNNVLALKPGDIDGSNITIQTTLFDDIAKIVSRVGTFIAVGVLMVIGIRYMMGSLEERASYKKSMMPYVIGCFILFGAANLAPMINSLFSNIGNSTEAIGNSILGIIRLVGTFISVGGLMIMGIRYMTGSVEERASYKKSMIPYIVGMGLLFGAVNIKIKGGKLYEKTNQSFTYTYDSYDGIYGCKPSTSYSRWCANKS